MADDRSAFTEARDAGKAIHQAQRLARAQQRDCPGCGQDGTGLESHNFDCLRHPVNSAGLVEKPVDDRSAFTEAQNEPSAREDAARRVRGAMAGLRAAAARVESSPQRLENATYTAVEVKALTKTAADLAYALGRKEALEELADKASAIAAILADKATAQRDLGIQRRTEKPKAAERHMRAGINFSNQAAGVWEVAHLAREMATGEAS